MTQELTPAQMKKMGVSQGTGYKTIRVDNGDNKVGLNATGEWVIKTKNGEGNFDREKLGKTIKGVFLASRAKVFSKYTEQAGAMKWYSDEFNSSDPSEVFRCYVAGEKRQLFEGTYKMLKDEFTIDKAGQITKLYSYKTYLYFLIDGEIVKLELTGMSQGNWFEYPTPEANLLRVYTECEIVVHEDEKGKSYMATFRDGEDCGNVFAQNLEALDSLPESNAAPVLSASAPTQELPPVQEGVPLPPEPEEHQLAQAEPSTDALSDILKDKGMA